MVKTRGQKKLLENNKNVQWRFSSLKQKFGINRCSVSLQKLTPQQIQKFTQNVSKIVEVKTIAVPCLPEARRLQPKRAAKEPKILEIRDNVEDEIHSKPMALVKSTKNTQRKIILPIEVGQHVLAKQKYSVPWPARVLAVRKTSADVHFYGDGRSGPVNRKEISMISQQVICENIRKNIPNYKKAVNELEMITKEILLPF